MTPKEYMHLSFERWWLDKQESRMGKSKYLAKKAWLAAYKESWPLFIKIQEKLDKKYEQFLFG